MRRYNFLNKEELIKKLEGENFERQTISFYRYVTIVDPEEFRNRLFDKFQSLDCLGRIYIAGEGINAQMNFPKHHQQTILDFLNQVNELKNIPIKWAVEDDSTSFYKLIIKVKNKIVADGLDDNSFDPSNVGKHLTATEFNQAMDTPGAIVVDMRNNYESEVGRFEGAICPDAVTFREELIMVNQLLDGKKNAPILLYCTGGVRCEKASAYLKHQGFQNVSQLHGGIIDYVRQIRTTGESSRFKGKNFVFDNRMGEKITDDVLAKCHQCGKPCDHHINCANDQCHLLFIQCEECKQKYQECCSEECKNLVIQEVKPSFQKYHGKKWRRTNGEIVRI